MGCFGDKGRGCSTYTSCRGQSATQEMHQREAGRGFVRLNEAFALQVGPNCPLINRTHKSRAHHTDQRPLTLQFAFIFSSRDSPQNYIFPVSSLNKSKSMKLKQKTTITCISRDNYERRVLQHKEVEGINGV